VLVRRIVLAWKKLHRLDDSIWWFSPAVWALFPNISDIDRNRASTAISRATFLLTLESWPWPPPC
jgi:hypothetical protein